MSITITAPSPTAEKAGEVTTTILRTPETGALWNTYYHSQREIDPAAQTADEIEKRGADILRDPALAHFMLQLIEIEKNAAKNPELKTPLQAIEDFLRNEIKKSGHSTPEQTITDLNKALDFLKGTERPNRKRLKHLTKKLKRQKITDLEKREIRDLKILHDRYTQDIESVKTDLETVENQKKFIEAYRHHAGQNPLGLTALYKMLWGLLKDVGHHVKEESKERPKSFATLSAVVLGLFVFMRYRMPGSATMYIDPDSLRVASMSMNDFMDPDFVPDLTDPLITSNTELPWHDHLTQIVGDSASEVIRQIPGIEYITPIHRAQLLNQAETAQNRLQWGYDLINLRIDTIIKEPAENLGSALIPDSLFKQAFNDATFQAQALVCFANTMENIVLHGLLWGASHAITYDLKTLSSDEATEHWNEGSDVVRRFWRNSKLSLSFGAAAAAYAHNIYGEFNPVMIWMGVAGLAAGEYVHRFLRKKAYSKKQSNLITTSKELTHFADPSFITTKSLSEKVASYVPGFLKNKFTWVAAATGTVMATADIFLNNAIGTGAALGHAIVWVPFMGYNAIEDAALHIIFAVIGMGTGYTHAQIESAWSRLRHGKDASANNMEKAIEELLTELAPSAPSPASAPEMT